MNRFARIMQFLGWVGVALLSGMWALGFSVGEDTVLLSRHTAGALAAACLCVLPRFWTIAYLALAARGRARRQPSAGGAPATTAGRQASMRRRVRQWANIASIAALVGLAVAFAIAGSVLLRRVSPLVHALSGAGAVALQIVALLLERRALLVDAAEMAEITSWEGEPGDRRP
jgi:hypothetical protein